MPGPHLRAMPDSTATGAAGDLAKTGLLVALALVGALYLVTFARAVLKARASGDVAPTPWGLAIGFVTNFFDTLGIGSYATTTSAWRALKLVPDEKIPGTLNVGHTLGTITQTFIFTKIVPVESTTLILMIIAAMAGSWMGAGVVSGWSRRNIQLGMGAALLGAAILLFTSLVGITPAGGEALGVTGTRLALALTGNFVLGALMTLGIGLYAPCMILVSLLGMNVQAAFPIMMGSCAFLMPVASGKFIRTGGYDMKAALGLAIGGVPAVLIAAFLVKTLPLTVLRWIVLVVILYTAATLLRAGVAAREQRV
jgi:uncharacterized membrane protein YfcA